MDGDEEPTEITAMTESGASSANCHDVACDSGLPADDTKTSWDHSSAFVRRFIKTPKGMGIAAVVIIIIVVFFALILAKIVTGTLHLGSCALDPFVPVYMVSSGALFLAFLVALLLVCVKCRHQGENEDDDRVSPLHLLVLFYFFIHIVLQLAGSVCVIRARNDLQEQLRTVLASPVTESTVIAQHTVKLIAPEVTPAYPLLEPVVYVAPVKTRPVRPPATCSADLLNFAFAAVVVELIISGFFFIFIMACLLELAYIVYYEPTVGIKKTMTKANKRDSFISA